MRLLLSLSPILALSFLVADVAANPHGSPHVARHPHGSVARRAPGDVAVHHHKRFTDAKFSFYDVGLGSCGGWNVAQDFVVALNSPQYGGSSVTPQCGKQISISFGGKSTTATIVDQCPGCPWGGLDLSRGLFNFLANPDAGIIYGEWHFTDGDQQPAPTPDPPKPTQETPTPTPTTTNEVPSTTPPPPPPSTTSSSSSSSSTRSSSSSSQGPSSSSSSSSINYSSGAASNLAVPTGVTVPDNTPHNILAMYQAMVAVGSVIVAGEKAA